MIKWSRRRRFKNVYSPQIFWRKTAVVFLLIFWSIGHAKGQFFQTGQDPSSIRWRQINTANFQVIYPEEFENQAQRVAFILNKVYDYGSNTLSYRPHKVSVVLHTRTVQSNGLVAWAPKRVELFTTPNQQIYSQDWLEELGLHEFRHLVQMDKIQSELPLIIKAILGEQAAAVVVGAYLPFWFLEGDAVVTETALSKTGRGRMASFSMDYRAQLLEKSKFSFDKAYLGSYKNYVPDYYQLGYWMVAKSREKYGPEIWEKTLQKIGHNPFSLTPLNSTIKEVSGLSTKKLYERIFDELKTEWQDSLRKRSIDSLTICSSERKIYTQYLYPAFYNDSIIFAYRTSLDDIGRFVLVYPDGTEKVIYTPGSIFEESVSFRNNRVIWAENRSDIRWTHSDRSVIQVLNIENKVRKEIHPENKLFSPVISPDLQSFAAVEVDPANDFYLSVFDLQTGAVKFRFKTPDNQYLFTPCWDAKGEKLFAVFLSEKGKYLASVDLKTKQSEPLTEPTFANLRNPDWFDNQLIFTADFSGVDNLYTLNLVSKSIRQVASVRFGADYPAVSPSGKIILFSNYTADGYQLATLPNSGTGKKIQNIQLQPVRLAENLASQEKGIPDLVKSDSLKFQSKNYSKLGHLFNFHSWDPVYIDIDNYEIHPGASVFSQNVLGTAETRLGYDYNSADRTGEYEIAFKYKGWFPEIEAEFSMGKAASNYYLVTNTVNQFNQVIKSDTTLERFTWQNITASLDMRLPLNLSKGKYSRIFYPEFKYSFNQNTPNGFAPENFNSGYYHTLAYRIYFYNLLHQSSQNLMPRWGQQVDMIFQHTPLAGNDMGSIAGVQGAFYFPGLTKNSGLRIYQGFQQKHFVSVHTFTDFIRFPRGFPSYQNDKMYSLAIDYKFPLFYPDFSVSRFTYVKRIKTSLFYDYAWLSVPALDSDGNIHTGYHQLTQRSMGMELTSDLHFLRFFVPVELGCRAYYRPDYQDFGFNLLLSVNFNGF